jgi:hypothetical protein
VAPIEQGSLTRLVASEACCLFACGALLGAASKLATHNTIAADKATGISLQRGNILLLIFVFTV